MVLMSLFPFNYFASVKVKKGIIGISHPVDREKRPQSPVSRSSLATAPHVPHPEPPARCQRQSPRRGTLLRRKTNAIATRCSKCRHQPRWMPRLVAVPKAKLQGLLRRRRQEEAIEDGPDRSIVAAFRRSPSAGVGFLSRTLSKPTAAAAAGSGNRDGDAAGLDGLAAPSASTSSQSSVSATCPHTCMHHSLLIVFSLIFL